MAKTKSGRAPIKQADAADIMIRCRRRCCLCYYLDADLNKKNGQLAHINRDHSNSKPENLAYLCLDHHNEYDSLPKQTRRLTEIELRHARELLHQHVAAQESHVENKVKVTIELEQDFETFDEKSRSSLLELVQQALSNNAEVQIVSVKAGSVLVTLEIDASSAQQLIAAFREGMLDSVNAVDIALDDLHGVGEEEDNEGKLDESTIPFPRDIRIFISAVSGDPDGLATFRSSDQPRSLHRIVDHLESVSATAAGGVVRYSPSPIPVTRLFGSPPHKIGLLPAPIDSEGTRPFVELRGLTEVSQRLLDSELVRLSEDNCVIVESTTHTGWLRYVASYEAGSWSNFLLVPVAIGSVVEIEARESDLIDHAFQLAANLAGHAAWSTVVEKLHRDEEPLRSALLFKVVATVLARLKYDQLEPSTDDRLLPESAKFDFYGKINIALANLMTGLITEMNTLFHGE